MALCLAELINSFILTTEIVARTLFATTQSLGQKATQSGEDIMRIAILAAVLAALGFGSGAFAEGIKIGVSWSNFQEPRWKFDAAAMRSSIHVTATTMLRPMRKPRPKSS
jgi:hypothetical protein